MLSTPYFQMISLLKRALMSQQALTGLFFDVAITPDAVNLDQLPENFLQPKNAEHKFKSIKVKLIQTKDDALVLYAEAGQDFIDLIFGLLSFPLGSRLMDSGPQMGALTIFTKNCCYPQSWRPTLVAASMYFRLEN
jgi:hypothetical protein